MKQIDPLNDRSVSAVSIVGKSCTVAGEPGKKMPALARSYRSSVLLVPEGMLHLLREDALVSGWRARSRRTKIPLVEAEARF